MNTPHTKVSELEYREHVTRGNGHCKFKPLSRTQYQRVVDKIKEGPRK